MSILKIIVQNTQEETNKRKSLVPVASLEKSPLFSRKTVSLSQALSTKQSSGIIAEFKRASPSKGDIHPGAQPQTIVRGYDKAGAAAISVLTDTKFFSGSPEDLKKARSVTSLPLLRKDFITDEYQILEAKALGADAVLLIAAILEPPAIKKLTTLAKELELEILFEIHEIDEIHKIPPSAASIGINNRNLNNFTVNINKALDMIPLLPEGMVKVAESGISDPETVAVLKAHGYQGFLVGETFMKTSDPGTACRNFISDISYRRNLSRL